MARRRKLSKAEKLNRDIARWEAKQDGAVIMLRKSAEMLLKLRRKRRRQLEVETTRALLTRREAEAAPSAAPASPSTEATQMDGGKDEGIPAFLDRARKLQAMPDPRTKEKKAERRAVEKEKLQAELTGKRRKMPLSGKAALAALREER